MSLDNEIRALRRIKRGGPEKKAVTIVHNLMKQRIFKDGLNSKKQRIGTYSKGYQQKRRREGVRPIAKVVLKFTGEMAKAFNVIDTPGGLKSGFTDFKSAAKAGFVTSTYEQEIFALTRDEEEILEDVLNNEIRNVFQSAT